MKHLLANLGVNLVSLGCVAAAGYLAAHDKDGWGWFLFIALICTGTASIKDR